MTFLNLCKGFWVLRHVSITVFVLSQTKRRTEGLEDFDIIILMVILFVIEVLEEKISSLRWTESDRIVVCFTVDIYIVFFFSWLIVNSEGHVNVFVERLLLSGLLHVSTTRDFPVRFGGRKKLAHHMVFRYRGLLCSNHDGWLEVYVLTVGGRIVPE